MAVKFTVFLASGLFTAAQPYRPLVLELFTGGSEINFKEQSGHPP